MRTKQERLSLRGMDFAGDKAVIKKRKINVVLIRERVVGRKRQRHQSMGSALKIDYLDCLPDDIVLSVLSKLSSSADSSADFFSILISCKRFNGLGFDPMVLSVASLKMLAVKAASWTESTHRFLKLCLDAGNLEACYILGMIQFYCLQNQGSGVLLMAKAAMASHAQALYSLAIMQFNGSVGSKTDKDLRIGVALCARAARMGNHDALRELGHCFQVGYGVKRNVLKGRQLLIQANVSEVYAAAAPSASLHDLWAALKTILRHHFHLGGGGGVTSCPLLSDFGCNVPVPEPHPANKFLAEWFQPFVGIPGVEFRVCCNPGCGRPELRRNEFRRCSVCGSVNYCSRACQAMHWRSRHKSECVPTVRWPVENVENPVVNIN